MKERMLVDHNSVNEKNGFGGTHNCQKCTRGVSKNPLKITQENRDFSGILRSEDRYAAMRSFVLGPFLKNPKIAQFLPERAKRARYARLGGITTINSTAADRV